MAGRSVFASAVLCFLSTRDGIVSGEHSSPTAHHKGAYTEKKRGGRGLRNGQRTPVVQLREGMREAIDEALGVGHGIEQDRLEAIHRDIEPMWRSLAKNTEGRLDHRSLRYVTQRYFLRTHSLSIVGLEANHANSTHSKASLLTSYAPNYVRKSIEGNGTRDGYSVEDAVAMIAALRCLIEHSGRHVLEDVYNVQGHDHRQELSREDMGELLEGYMLRWMMGDDLESIQMLEANETLKQVSFEDWPLIKQFAQGRASNFEFARLHPQTRNQSGAHVSTWNALRPHFRFADAQEMVGGIALSFGDYWATECAKVEESLLEMDHSKNGRVKLSDFHGAALNGEWRFSESKDYLRQMGALDETSSWHGPRVIVTNYLQAPSNCIVSTEHYRVCCANECELHLSELEASIGAPAATPEEILPIIERLSSGFDDEPRLTPALKSQLQRISHTDSGKVPIHGRLFAQWLHHVFPLQCPFPHLAGTITALTPIAFGDAFMASEEEMSINSEEAKIDERGENVSVAEDEWMSMWSHEEELLIDKLHAPWQADFSTSVLGLMFMVGVCVLLAKSGIISSNSGKAVLPTMNSMKSHYI